MVFLAIWSYLLCIQFEAMSCWNSSWCMTSASIILRNHWAQLQVSGSIEILLLHIGFYSPFTALCHQGRTLCCSVIVIKSWSLWCKSDFSADASRTWKSKNKNMKVTICCFSHLYQRLTTHHLGQTYICTTTWPCGTQKLIGIKDSSCTLHSRCEWTDPDICVVAVWEVRVYPKSVLKYLKPGVGLMKWPPSK